MSLKYNLKCPKCKKDVYIWDGGTGMSLMDYYCCDWGQCDFTVHSIAYATTQRFAEDAVPVPRV